MGKPSWSGWRRSTSGAETAPPKDSQALAVAERLSRGLARRYAPGDAPHCEPWVFFVDKTATLADRTEGATSYEELEASLKQIL